MGSYMAGALARFNNNYDQLHPEAKKLAEAFEFKPLCFNPYMNSVAQLVEVVHSVKDSIRLIDEVLRAGFKPEELIDDIEFEGVAAYLGEADVGAHAPCHPLGRSEQVARRHLKKDGQTLPQQEHKDQQHKADSGKSQHPNQGFHEELSPMRARQSCLASVGHPSTTFLLKRYETQKQYRRLAVVHAVGSPDPTRSHFDAQDFQESGTPGVNDASYAFAGRTELRGKTFVKLMRDGVGSWWEILPDNHGRFGGKRRQTSRLLHRRLEPGKEAACGTLARIGWSIRRVLLQDRQRERCLGWHVPVR